MKAEERFCQDVQTRVNKAKFEGQIHIFVSIMSQTGLNETDAETIYCILDDQFTGNGKELKKLGWLDSHLTDVTKKIICFYRTDFFYLNSDSKFWGFGHHKNIFSSFSA